MDEAAQQRADWEAGLGPIVMSALARSRHSQRSLAARTGYTKDTLSRMLSGRRKMSSGEATTLLEALQEPARGIVMLALFERSRLIDDWTATEAAAFLETLVAELPGALSTELGDDLGSIRSHWGKAGAHLIAKRLAKHIAETRRHEQLISDDEPARLRAVGN